MVRREYSNFKADIEEGDAPREWPYERYTKVALLTFQLEAVKGMWPSAGDLYYTRW